MFWGVTLESGKRYSQVVDMSYHLSMAALEPKAGGEPVMVMLEHGKAEFLLCTLDQAHARQVALDLNFVEGEEVTFFLNGRGTVHLTGYLTDGLQDDTVSSDDEEEEEEASLQDEDEEDEDNELTLARKRPLKVSKKLKESLLQAVNGDSEEDDSDFDVNKVEDGTEDDDDDDEDEEVSVEEEPEPMPALPHKRPAKKRLLGKPMSNASPSKEQGTSSSAAAEPQDGVPKKKRKKMKQRSEGAAAVSGSPKVQQSPQGGAAGEKGTLLPGGVISTDLRTGNGPVAKPGKNVHVYYTGRLANNHVFDKCLSGKAFSFRLGKHEVIKGWETGIEGMKVGGKRRLVIPPNQAYGNTRMGSIPANSTLYFEVELKAVS
ncbi:46 kDa FK506-binding nuclear protein [Rhipicephalus sanguineus]|uniref:46 kDa FK506-binding nuclear protein n=1 Tax=Rhipicephalus sanguineus TaxID=34632 RepID=UPI00189557A3|nr:46 kDa FK506-binding nuclear protein [Rhipicephalus sanguineus]